MSLRLLLLAVALAGVALQGEETRFYRIAGPVPTIITAFDTQGYLTWTNEVTNATFSVQVARTLTGPSNWVDYVQIVTTQGTTTLQLFDPNPPPGMVLIPAGSFTMGDTFNELPNYLLTRPAHRVHVSAFYIGRHPVTKGLWDEVKQWALTNGYDFVGTAWSPRPSNYPVTVVNWYDTVKWCNARSQKEGLTPCYYTNDLLTQVYTSGQVTNPCVNWSANGYRLPTEAEWEKAARGGLAGKRFPWGDTITHDLANYYSTTNYSYDISPTREWHPDYQTTNTPYTSPVGSFDPNGYGLYDMAGNVWDWCWDWDGPYTSEAQSDPHGPISGSYRMRRGGNWNDTSQMARCDYRFSGRPDYAGWGHGFRLACRQ